MIVGNVVQFGSRSVHSKLLNYYLLAMQNGYGICVSCDNSEFALQGDITSHIDEAVFYYRAIYNGCVFPCQLSEVVYELMVKIES